MGEPAFSGLEAETDRPQSHKHKDEYPAYLQDGGNHGHASDHTVASDIYGKGSDDEPSGEQRHKKPTSMSNSCKV
ncbi:hypothetical protein [Henriciella sp.]|uniref:hypothetical protein n=1 Tax=Henriciella sp. TaxID=1968823 RepID=UPI00261C9055|nr:hypothetical protein [Henriciella sp.]